MANYLIIPVKKGLKPDKAKDRPEALVKATTMSMTHPGVEVHVYELHSRFKSSQPTETR
jgi:hypothetical protein